MVIVVAVALIGVITWQIRAQQAELDGPATGSGVIEAEGLDLSARLGARVVAIPVQEGEAVAEGAVLLELDCAEPEARLAEAQARLEVARAQAEAAGSSAVAASRSQQAARASVASAGAQARALDAQRDVAHREAERVESMGEHAATSRRDQARSAATGLEAQARAARASRSMRARQAAAASSQAEAASASATAAQHGIAAVEAAIRSAEIAVGECRIVAPRAGVVERIYYDAGELVTPGAVVARLIDPSVVTATFYLPNADVDEATVGASVRVEVDAFEDREFSGTVERIGLEAEFTPRNIQTRSDRDRLVFPVEVRIPNEGGALRSGMPVTVTLDGAS